MGSEWLRQRAGVLAEPNFRRFYTGYVTSLFGSSMSTVAIAWAVLDSGASASGLGVVFAAAVVPQVLVLPVAGAIADRFGRRRVMLSADVLRCATQGSLAGTVLAGRPALWVFVLLAWLGGTGEGFFTAARDALTVEIAPRGQLVNANALYGLARSATSIGGPALGGVLVALAGSGVVVAVDAGSYAVSVLALSLLRLPGQLTAGEGKAGGGRWLRRDIAAGWAEFRSLTWLWVVTVQFAFFNLITWAPWMLLGPVAAHAYLGGPAVWGAVMAAQGAGAIVAGLLALGRRPRRPMVVATIGTFCYALPDLPMALHAPAGWVAAAAFCCGAGSATSGIFGGTAVQQRVPPELLARVNALSLFPAFGIGVIGYAIDGPLYAAFGPALVFGVGAAYGLLSSAAVLTLRSIRDVTWTERDEPERDEPAPGDLTAAAPPPRAARRRPPAAPPP
ncbi:MAG: MFS transporter [Streptosporangiaceae bacterium]|jgi:MFS family permease